MPPVVGVPTAAERPEVVGSDPSLVHFAVGEVPAEPPGLMWVGWSSGPGLERVDLVALQVKTTRRGPDLNILKPHGYEPIAIVELAVDPAKFSVPETPHEDPGTVTQRDVVVNGRPGVLTSRERTSHASERWLRWQPADGVWAQVRVRAHPAELALRVAETVTVDRVGRCAAPLTLG